MKLRCIYSGTKDFITNKEYKVINVAFSPLLVGEEYNIKDEKNRKRSTILDGLFWKFEIVEDNEMKELNIIEASKMLNTKFEVIYPNGNKRSRKLKTDSNGNLYNYDNEPIGKVYFHDIIQAKFIPLPKEIEVDFMEAIKTYGEGKTIICKIGNNQTEFKPQALFTNDNPILDEFEDGITAKKILEGKWYIID